ncbi:MAG: ClpXP protease specificity-enhancing factor, partial [Gammaproteobacteria bacterium]|nr:ClpXP protease specificity-enhancing factor [Gammaproteobacteria bacterium]
MTSSRPYLIRALFEWINDNGLTPYILVNTEIPDVQVPQQHIQDGKIILNIAPSAVQELDLGNDGIIFSARFSGVSMLVRVPVEAVLSIYAMESGEGMVFSEADAGGDPPDD